MKKVDRLFGTMGWCGVHEGMPAAVGSYHGGATLYVFRDGEWQAYAKSTMESDVIPHKCTCGASLPHENVF